MQSFIGKFLKLESAGGITLLATSALALIFANSFLSPYYFELLNTPVVVQFGEQGIAKPFLLWVNDGLMAVFFVLVGLEVKREIVLGSLSSYQQAILPVLAALGGMVVPALVFTFFNFNDPVAMEGWAIPMATDIAFALGIMALLGKRVPLPLKIFLLALAIIDDLGAIIVIALFFAHGLSTEAMLGAGLSVIILIIMNRMRISALCAYLFVGMVLWICVLKSGVHATLAGVILGFTIPITAKDGSSPLESLEHALNPWSAFFILPIFAFANAGVPLGGVNLETLAGALPLGIMLGLLIGKPLGVFSFCFIAIKLKIAKLPLLVNLKHIFAVSVLCGIGFTMSMFLSGLAFEEAGESINTLSRIGILLGSTISAVLGLVLLRASTNTSSAVTQKNL
ncbi:Na+/H+ antiporter NhaA [Testudinibacter sp. TR-2022]|uniref:Na+/H+ antiporter NhaA n=1 Tax=Testudinibacter sp. TR-2022 TaxID=2585029 RepID=UPI001119975F|nr:Na+/H+ antiporter NhaA [Testudinibacter sp. TR-2022]TNH08864.1 Na+/H+ antiporter NhaA [Pasteurellaceae bacterium Phil11]TNH25731.1 Na+/H+ antiporter NhaA [Testudinibacter sp. TR-2022]TNH25910.1 Na+/H+ antiporter NhaA [Testudinibacter sp. TR-2022]